MSINDFIANIRSETIERKIKNNVCRTELKKFSARQRVSFGIYETKDSRGLIYQCVLDTASKNELQELVKILRDRYYAQCEWVNLCNDMVFKNQPLPLPIDEYSTYVEKVLQSKNNNNPNLFDKRNGINSRSQFWLLLIASIARGAVYEDLPDFIEKSFQRFDVPSSLNRDECGASVGEFLKSKPWRGIRNQEDMLAFIKDHRKQEAKRKEDERIANYLFVQLKDFSW